MMSRFLEWAMRTDVKKVIAERPKANRTWQNNTPRPKSVKLDEDGEQFDEGANDPLQKRQKMRNTSFNILKRFLTKKVGSNWDKVFSEICRNADSRSFQGEEIRQVAQGMVAIDCWMIGKNVLTRDWQGRTAEVKGFYVHPKSGLLLRK
jgi:hypothetical protein